MWEKKEMKKKFKRNENTHTKKNYDSSFWIQMAESCFKFNVTRCKECTGDLEGQKRSEGRMGLKYEKEIPGRNTFENG